MATYKETVGTAVVNYAGNYPGAVEGELWYDSTNKDFKYQYPALTTTGSWRSGANLNTGRVRLSSAGLYNTALAIGGEVSDNVGNTELYNGVSWTELNDLTTARYYGAGAGTSTAAIMIGGTPSAKDNTELWNGTNWTEVNDMSRPASTPSLASFGTQSAAVGAGGYPIVGLTETWDGTSWTEVADLATARYALEGLGTSSLALAAGGEVPPYSNATEEWTFSHPYKKVTTE